MLKAGVIILIIMLALGGIYSIMNIIVPSLMMRTSLSATTGKSLDDARNDGYSKALITAQIKLGIVGLTSAVAGFFVLFSAFRKSQKWSWFTFLFGAGILWLGTLLTGAIVGDLNCLIVSIVGLVLLLLGILIPIKSFFTKSEQS